MKRSLFLVALLVACLTAVGCKSTPKRQVSWAEGHVDVNTPEMLWQVVQLGFESQRLPVLAQFDPNTRMAESGWDIQLAPFRGNGWREKAQVRYERAKSGKGFEVEVRVVRDANMALANPLDLSYAIWEPRDDNTVRSRLLLRYLQNVTGTKPELPERPSGNAHRASPFETR
mgnify:CR=1 FL=1